MTTPSVETLDAICVLITGDEHAKFAQIDVPEQRVEVIKMAIGCELNEILDDIETDLDVLRQWFKVSRPYDGV